ncbi:MAG: DUF882 domain-containing protein [Deltaproteobacteria bacterium]|jgi:uncharacterized protein YcbK (DUF882 family)|nr:DUF882 domain-containing protein [Deltaproteobacteria bacterium]
MSGHGRSVQLTLLLLQGAFILLLLTAPSRAVENQPPERRLSFYNTHTRERLTVVYKKGGGYILGAMEKISKILRDHRADEIHAIDPGLMDFLYDLLTEVDNHGEVHIISGYRSPKTNTKLRRKSKGVARGSLHMQGKALDFRLPGTDTVVLRDTARRMKRGGVGYYRKSDFIQIDTGRVRNW